MKKLLLILCCALAFATGFSQQLPARPNPPKLVNDFAGVLSPEQVDILERKLVALDDSTSNQIAVVLVKSLDGNEIADYSVKLFREWGIGNKKTNNGVLILASMDEHKIWITVGYGLEGAIPDAMASSIYRNEMVPEFKQQNYYRGIDNAIDALAKAAAGEYHVKRERPSSGGRGGSPIGFIILIIVILIVSMIGRGGRGGRGGGMASRGGFGDIATGMILGSLLGGGRGGSSGWGSSGGGFGGGGFGGFGGGSSGGGGAGGSW